MYNGPKGGGLRTPRTIAEEKGTDSGGFSDAPNYFPQGGHPTGKDMPSPSPYKETPLTGGGSGGNTHDPKPFSIKGS